MRYIIDHDLHIHTLLSRCAKHEENTVENIIACAKEINLKKIAFTDHFWDEEIKCDVPGGKVGFDIIKKSRPLPKDKDIKALFGCEAEVNYDLVVGVSEKRFKEFDIILLSLTHNQKVGRTIRKEDYMKPERLSYLWVERALGVLNQNLPFHKIGLSHLTSPYIADNIKNENDEIYKKTLDLIKDDDIERVFTLAAKRGVGIELNATDMNYSDENKDRVLKFYRIAKECGCKFYCGSDSHSLESIKKKRVSLIERAIDELGLTEDDKWEIARSD